MNLRIGIQPDFIRHRNGEEQSYSARWEELARSRGIEVDHVDVESDDFFSRIRGCDGFMWRFGYDRWSLDVAKRVLPALEHALELPVFPSWESCWHFEDKTAQHFLMQAAGIPSPRTWIFWNRRSATDFCRSARYPLVAKLSSGYQSNNVRLLRSFEEARDVVELIFGAGLVSLQPQRNPLKQIARHRLQAVRLLFGKPLPDEIQHGYFYVQEFLPGNEFDTRVTVIGNRAFAFRRLNRPGDFRASGSGRIDWDPAAIDQQTVRLAFDAARKLRTQSLAIDGLRRGTERVVGELSYTYASWAIRDCPGHWVCDGPSATGDLVWKEGQLRAEDAIFADFIELAARKGEGNASGRAAEGAMAV